MEILSNYGRYCSYVEAPAEPTVERPAEPTVERPTEPTVERPTEPTVERPTAPLAPTVRQAPVIHRNPQLNCSYGYPWYYYVLSAVVIIVIIVIICRVCQRRRQNRQQNRFNNTPSQQTNYVRHTDQQVNQISTNIHTQPNPTTMQQQYNPVPQAYPYNQPQQYNQNPQIVEINANQPSLIPHRQITLNTQQQQPQYPANQNLYYSQQQIINTQSRWSGRFWQEGQVDEMKFDNMIMEQDGALRGSGSDAVGGFNLSGHCSENGHTEINKKYHGAHTVHYRGQMDNNGWIKGKWEIPGNCGGTFELHVENQA